jgi:hypothetical protein
MGSPGYSEYSRGTLGTQGVLQELKGYSRERTRSSTAWPADSVAARRRTSLEDRSVAACTRGGTVAFITERCSVRAPCCNALRWCNMVRGGCNRRMGRQRCACAHARSATHTHTHTYTHTRTHARTHTHLHTHTHTHTHNISAPVRRLDLPAHTHKHTRTHARRHTDSLSHTRTHTNTHARTHAGTRTLSHTHAHTHAHTDTHKTHAHTRMRTHTRARTHAHTHRRPLGACSVRRA